MNCAVHTDQPATVYCRTCGKALCDTCKHDVRGVIYCEDCIAARVQGTFPATSPNPSGTVPAAVPGGPNPALATILAVFFPFGVASVYNGQYAKGLAHLLVFLGIIAAGHAPGMPEPIPILAGFAYYAYQIIDANRSAKAISSGEPAPDPFGLAKALGSEHLTPQNVPIGAIILIAIGVLFLLQNIGMFHIHWVGKLWPLVLIALGLRIIMRNKR